MPQQAERTRPIFHQRIRGHIAQQKQSDLHRRHHFQHIGEDNCQRQGAAEGAVKIGQSGVAAAVGAHIVPQDVFGDDHRPVEAAAEIGYSCAGRKNQRGKGLRRHHTF